MTGDWRLGRRLSLSKSRTGDWGIERLRLKIRSISASLIDSLSRPTSSTHYALRITHYTLLSRHDRALNLRSPTGEILGLVWPDLGNGPFHAVLAQPVDFSSVDPADVELDLSTAALWNPRIANCELRIAPLSLPPSLLPSLSSSLPHHLIIASSLSSLTTALRRGDLSQIATSAAALAGLGPGLTPAGDDALVGVMAGLWICPAMLHPSLGVDSACQSLVENAVPRTTTLSSAWLRHAARGEFGEPWHRLAHALHVDDPHALDAAVAAIVSFGAFSGADALSGFHVWMGGEA